MRDILTACAMTVVMETAFFGVFGYRKSFERTVIVCSNVITNLLLNLLFLTVFSRQDLLLTALSELAVWGVEYGIYRYAFGASRSLLFLTAAANLLSYSAGRFYYFLRAAGT